MKMPVFFIGHGSPMNAIEDNSFTKSLSKMDKDLKEKPTAILVISAHWLTDGSYVNTTANPELIYDFYGFPDELYKVQYPATGAPEYAKMVTELILGVKENKKRGLDHGTWTILKYLFPKADIPTFQLSIDYHRPMQYHFDLAAKLNGLREKGVLIIGSGNIVHNLQMMDETKTYDWAIEFDELSKKLINEKDFDSLIDYKKFGKSAVLSIPTVDHYVPMLYALAVSDKKEKIVFTYEGIDLASISMRCFRIG